MEYVVWGVIVLSVVVSVVYVRRQWRGREASAEREAEERGEQPPGG